MLDLLAPHLANQEPPAVQRYLKARVDLQPAHMLRLWRAKPKYFFKDQFDLTLDPWQEDFVESYLVRERTVAVASKGVGKTIILGGCGLHMLALHHQPKIAALSVTKDHLMDNLWAEMTRLGHRSEMLKSSLNFNATSIEVKGEESYSFISARSFPKTASEDDMQSALAGLHATVVGALIDEAGSMPDSLFDTMDAILANNEAGAVVPKFARIMVCMNAERPTGLFNRIYHAKLKQEPTVESQQWNMINISSDPLDPKRSPRVSVEWAQGFIDKYGRDHARTKINILGVFPDTSEEILLSEKEVDDAMSRSYTHDQVSFKATRLGVDVSRGGDDTIIFPRQGLQAYQYLEVSPSIIRGQDLGKKVIEAAFKYKTREVTVDATGGYGLSVLDYLSEKYEVDAKGVIYNEASTAPKSYNNKRTEMWVKMRDWVRSGGALPKCPMLKEELLVPKLKTKGTQFILESKEDIKKRLKRSPDRADALAQTFMEPDDTDYGEESEFLNSEHFDPMVIKYAKQLAMQNTSTYDSGRGTTAKDILYGGNSLLR